MVGGVNIEIKECSFNDGFSNGIVIGAINARIQKCIINNNEGNGIVALFGSEGTNKGILEVSDTELINNAQGIYADCPRGNVGNLIITNVSSKNNKSDGVFLTNGINFSIRNLTCNNNGNHGLYLFLSKPTMSTSDIIESISCNNNGKSGIEGYYTTGTYGVESYGAWQLEIKNSVFEENDNGLNFQVNSDFNARNSSVLELKMDSVNIGSNKTTGFRQFGSRFSSKMNFVKFKSNLNTGCHIQSDYRIEAKDCEFGNNAYIGVHLSANGNIKYNAVSTFDLFRSSIYGSHLGLVVDSGENLDVVTLDNCKVFNNKFNKGLDYNEIPSTAIFFLGKSLMLSNSELYGNKAEGKSSGIVGNGGAIRSSGSNITFIGKTKTSYTIIPSILLLNSFFYENTATGAGGSIFANNSNLRIYNTVFAQNIASNQGGAIISVGEFTRTDDELVNCTFFDNITYDLEGGGAVSNNSTKAINLKNSIFYKNKHNKANNIFSSDIYSKSGSLIINSTLLQLDSTKYKVNANINFTGVGNYYNKDPKFLLPNYLEDNAQAHLKGGDKLFGTKDDALRLRDDSPFLNVGVNNFLANVNPSGLDAASNERIQDFVIDLGAYEGGVKIIHSIPEPATKTIIEGTTSTITLPLLTDYGNPVTYTLASGPAILKDNVITPTGKPGKIIVTGKANGTEKDGIINICVNPSKPSITLRDVEGDFFLKSSSETGNVWYNNNKKTNLTTQEIIAVYDSYYSLQVDIEGCLSTVSEETEIPKDKIHVISAVVFNDINEGSEKSFDLPTKTDLSNTINYTLTGPAAIQNGKLIVGNKPGLVQIVAKANKAPKDVSYKFCVIPSKPTISLIEKSGVYTIKSSSAGGNVWFKENTKIPISSQEILADYEATYTLQSDFEGCLSEKSESIVIPKLVILGFEKLDNELVSIYPVPASDRLNIILNKDVKFKTLKLVDSNGREFLEMDHNDISDYIQINLLPYPAGVYEIVLETDTLKVTKKVIKQ
jgi:hypothetical protein